MGKMTNKDIAQSLVNDIAKTNPGIASQLPEIATQNARELYDAFPAVANLKNIFIDTLINKIAMSKVSNIDWENPLKHLNKGKVDFGFIIEQLFVDDIEAVGFGENFDQGGSSEKDLLGTKAPKVKADYIQMNVMNKYKVSVSYQQLQTAFTSVYGLNDLVQKILMQVYVNAEVDDYELAACSLFQYIASAAVDGTGNDDMFVVGGTTAGWKPDDLLVEILDKTETLRYRSKKYNLGKVSTQTPSNKKILALSPRLHAMLSVNTYAKLFNLDQLKEDYRIVVFKELPTFTTKYKYPTEKVFTNASGVKQANKEYTIKSSLQNIQIDAILFDEDVCQLYDTLIEARQFENANTLISNYFLHKWKIVGNNPYKNAIAFAHKTS